MTIHFEYRMVGESYGFYVAGNRAFITDEVAFVFDLQDETVLRHGEPDMVDLFYQRMLRIAANRPHSRIGADPVSDVVANLELVQGRFALADLNRLVQTTGHVRRFYHDLQKDACAEWRQLLTRIAQPPHHRAVR